MKKNTEIEKMIAETIESVFTASQRMSLKSQEILEDSHGSILRDFGTILDFVGEGIQVSGKQNLFSRKSLIELNTRLTQPLKITLKQPVQKSFPHLNGLYLLLRASGISIIHQKKNKPYLCLEPEILASWNELNPTEKYFTLLETWWCWSDDEILGEYSTPISYLSRSLDFFEKISSSDLEISSDKDQGHLRYFPGLHNLALMELFGLIRIHHVEPKGEKEGWRFSKIQQTKWGETIHNTIKQVSNHLSEAVDEEEVQDALRIPLNDVMAGRFFNTSVYKAEMDFSAWVGLVSGFFPDLKNRLAFPEDEFQKGIFTFKVSLDKNIWRRIAMPASTTLDQLAQCILDAFEFDYDHLYEFVYKNRFGISESIGHPELQRELPITTNEFKVGDLPLQPGAQIYFHYDFGDNWQFDLLLESVDPAKSKKIKKPTVLESKGAPPPQYWDEEGEDWDEEDEAIVDEFISTIFPGFGQQKGGNVIPFPQKGKKGKF